MLARHAAVSLPVLLSAQSKSARLLSAKKENTKLELMILINVVLLHAAHSAQSQNVHHAHQLTFQLVNVTKILSVKPSMLTAVATNITVNATRTSASTSVKRLAQLVTHEPLSTQVLVVQLLDVAKSRPFQLFQQSHQ
jgi:hypothetical protein